MQAGFYSTQKHKWPSGLFPEKQLLFGYGGNEIGGRVGFSGLEGGGGGGHT